MEDSKNNTLSDEQTEKQQLLKELRKLRTENKILKERMERIKDLVSLR